MTSVTYPTGRVIIYTPDQVGRISRVDTLLNGQPKTLASSINYIQNLFHRSGFNPQPNLWVRLRWKYPL